MRALPHLICDAAPDSSRNAHEQGSIHVGNMSRLPEIFSELGGNPQQLLARCDMDMHMFESQIEDMPYRGIPISKALRLLSQAAKQVQCPHLGLLLGQRMESSLLGPVGFLMLHSPTVDAALKHLERFMHLRAEGFAITIDAQSMGVARFTFRIQIPQGEGVDQAHDLAMSSFVSFMRLACGRNWQPSAVTLNHPAPINLAPYHDVFGQFIRFDQSECTMTFPTYWLQHPVASANPSLGETIKNYMIQIESQYKDDIVGQVRRLLLTLLPTGKCTIDRVADLFAMHRRTLHRHLAAEGWTFESLLEATRRDLAERTLCNSEMPLGRVAESLGYRDISAFSRAFRRWHGISPGDWRAQCK